MSEWKKRVKEIERVSEWEQVRKNESEWKMCGVSGQFPYVARWPDFFFGHLYVHVKQHPICNRVSPFSVVCTININYCLWHACDTSRLRCVWKNTPLSHFHGRRKENYFMVHSSEKKKNKTRQIEIGNCYFRYCDIFVVLFCAKTLLLKRRNIISNAYLIRSKRAFFSHINPMHNISDIILSERKY